MPKDSNLAPELSPEKIDEYLAHLGLENDPDRQHVGCWNSLQSLAAGSVEGRMRDKPILNVRLSTYGLESAHPVRMLLRHVVS